MLVVPPRHPPAALDHGGAIPMASATASHSVPKYPSIAGTVAPPGEALSRSGTVDRRRRPRPRARSRAAARAPDADDDADDRQRQHDAVPPHRVVEAFRRRGHLELRRIESPDDQHQPERDRAGPRQRGQHDPHDGRQVAGDGHEGQPDAEQRRRSARPTTTRAHRGPPSQRRRARTRPRPSRGAPRPRSRGRRAVRRGRRRRDRRSRPAATAGSRRRRRRRSRRRRGEPAKAPRDRDEHAHGDMALEAEQCPDDDSEEPDDGILHSPVPFRHPRPVRRRRQDRTSGHDVPHRPASPDGRCADAVVRVGHAGPPGPAHRRPTSPPGLHPSP